MSSPAPNWRAALVDAAADRITLILALTSIIITYVFFLWTPESRVPFWALASVIIVAASLVWTLISALRRVINEERTNLPRLLAVIQGTSPNGLPILLLEPNDLFSIGSIVSIYHLDKSNGFEVLIGFGAVSTLQIDRKIQVSVEEWIRGNEDISEKIINQNIDIMSDTVIRPNAPKRSEEFVTRQEFFRFFEAFSANARHTEEEEI